MTKLEQNTRKIVALCDKIAHDKHKKAKQSIWNYLNNFTCFIKIRQSAPEYDNFKFVEY